MRLTDAHVVAVAKAITEDELKKARPNLEPGTHRLDVTVRIHGTLKVGEPYTQNIVGKVDWCGIAALAIDKLSGVTVMSLLAELEEGGPEIEDLKASTQAIVGDLKGTTKVPCNGKVTPRIAVERLARTR
jgi:hypothetical protein